MVWQFADQRSRNAVGRAVRERGYTCFATGPTASAAACLLTITETTDARRSAVSDLIRGMAMNGLPRPPER